MCSFDLYIQFYVDKIRAGNQIIVSAAILPPNDSKNKKIEMNPLVCFSVALILPSVINHVTFTVLYKPKILRLR